MKNILLILLVVGIASTYLIYGNVNDDNAKQCAIENNDEDNRYYNVLYYHNNNDQCCTYILNDNNKIGVGCE